MSSSKQALAVRRATAADAGALVQLAETTFTETFGHLYPADDLAAYISSAYSETACRAFLADPRMAYWVASAEHEPPVGFALAGYCKLPLQDLEPDAGELRQLYVRRTHQNLRLGARLLEAALTWLDAHYSPLYVGVWSNNVGAQRFYGRYGFVKVGEYGFAVGRTVDREFILKR
jgi:diamine N-acetyltransferase